MAYDDKLAVRLCAALGCQKGLTEKKMFGGLSFMLGGNMCCGVLKDDLVVRVGPGGFQEALAEPHVRPMDFTGRPIRGMVYVGPGGYRSDDDLAVWLKRGVDFARSLPPK